MDVVLKGFGFGLVLAIALGPVFFSLIQTSVERGFLAGMFMAFGISISDTFFVVLSYLGFSQFISIPEYKFYFSLFGGLILLLLGIYTIIRNRPGSRKNFVNNPRNIVRALAKGFVMNTVSPFVLIFWIGVMGFATVDLDFHGYDLRLFFGTILASVLVADITKAWLSNKLGILIKPRIIKLMNVLIGLILIGFALRLLYFVVIN